MSVITRIRADSVDLVAQLFVTGCVGIFACLMPIFLGQVSFYFLTKVRGFDRLTRPAERLIQKHEALKCLKEGDELFLLNIIGDPLMSVSYAVWFSVFLQMIYFSLVGWIAFAIGFPLWILSSVGSIVLLTFRFIHSKDVRFVCSIDGGMGTLLTWGLARLFYGADFAYLPTATQIAIALAGGLICVGLGLVSIRLIAWLETQNKTITT